MVCHLNFTERKGGFLSAWEAELLADVSKSLIINANKTEFLHSEICQGMQEKSNKTLIGDSQASLPGGWKYIYLPSGAIRRIPKPSKPSHFPQKDLHEQGTEASLEAARAGPNPGQIWRNKPLLSPQFSVFNFH